MKKTRKISSDEIILCKWLLENSDVVQTYSFDEYADVIPCECGCSSFSFFNYNKEEIIVISDWILENNNNEKNGVILFCQNNRLAGIDVYSLETKETIKETPKPFQMVSRF